MADSVFVHHKRWKSVMARYQGQYQQLQGEDTDYNVIIYLFIIINNTNNDNNNNNK